jgi:hypothetical protein
MMDRERMPKLLTSQELAQCFRELVELRAEVRKAERDLERSAKRNATQLPDSIVLQATGPVVVH